MGRYRLDSESRTVAGFCLLGALRIFFFAAAFPFFSNVDEQAHFDLVCKYARGHVPGGLEHWDREAARLIVLYDTPEYLEPPDRFPGGVYPPPHRIVTPADRESLARAVDSFIESDNHESTQPPVYYAVAGLWYRVGKAIGVHDGSLLYWVRFLNVAIAVLLILLAYVTARVVFPDATFLRLGVPLLVAFFPQDAFFLVNNDVLLPLVGGAAFLGLLLLCRGAPRSYAFHAGTGVLIAAAVLVKFSSVALLPIAAALVTYSIFRLDNAERAAARRRGAVLLVAAAVPIGIWCARSYVLFGDATGSLSKTRFLGWTPKPLGEILDHPIFTPAGAWSFWRDTLATFWRGELVWGLRPISSPGWDHFYALSSLVLIVAAVVALRRRRPLLYSALALFLLSLAFLAAISVAYDFGACFYPSRAKPFMTSGRLISGALIPFTMLYLSGFHALLPRRVPDAVRWALLIGLVAWMTLSELGLSRAAFASAHNWFHMD